MHPGLVGNLLEFLDDAKQSFKQLWFPLTHPRHSVTAVFVKWMDALMQTWFYGLLTSVFF